MKAVRRVAASIWLGLTLVMFMRSAEPVAFIGIPLWFAASFVSVVIHEAGHAAGAMLAGWRVVVFSVWRLAWHVPNRRIAMLGSSDLQELWGWVLAVPASARHDTNARQAIFTAGGPIANLVQAILAYLWAATASPGATILGAEAEPFLMGIAFLGLGLFIGNIIPHRDEATTNDGHHLLALLRNERPAGFREAPMWANAMLGTKVRLKDLPQWMLDEAMARADADPRLTRWCAMIEVGRTLDRSPVDAVLARSLIDRFREAYGPDDWLLACDAFLAATNERDLDRANRMLAQLGDPSTLPQMEAAARAAAFQLAGNRAAAADWLDRMDEIIAARSPFHDATFREIRARVEAIEPLERATPAALRGLSASA